MEFFDLLDFYFEKIQIPLNSAQRELFYEFYKILKQKNEELNLTRIHSLDGIIRKHFVDSCIILSLLEKKNISISNPVMDLGTGAGFPSIPLAILRKELEFLLVESRKDRVDFLNTVKTLLELDNITVIHRTLTYRDEIFCNTVITRALEPMKETALRTAGSLAKEGLLLFMKGPGVHSEIEEMNPKFFELLAKFSYELPSRDKEEDKRTLLIYKKKVENEVLKKTVNRKYFTLQKYVSIRSIESPQNTYYKQLKRLSSAKGITGTGTTIIAGEKIIKEFINAFPRNIISILFTKDTPEEELEEYRNLLSRMHATAGFVYLDKPLLQELEFASYPPPYLHVTIPELRSLKDFDFSRPFLVLPLQDPNNLGACIRTAVAFHIHNIILTKESSHPFLLKSIRSSSGAVFHAKYFLAKEDDRIKHFENIPVPLYLLHTAGKALTELSGIPEIFGLVLGEEGEGLPDDFLRLPYPKITIPVSGNVDSLNVAVSCGIALFFLRNAAKNKIQL